MKSLFAILILFTILSCTDGRNKFKKEKYFYPSKDYVLGSGKYAIELDTSSLNFKDYVMYFNSSKRKDSSFYFLIKDGALEYNLEPFPFDRAGLVKFKNILQVSRDSILSGYGHELKELSKILKIFYENNGKNPIYPDSAKKVVIMITIENESSSKEIQTLLTQIVREFNKLNKVHNDSLQFKFVFDNFRQIPPPPPPPEVN